MARVELVGAALLGIPRIAMAHRVWNRYGAAGGPLLARGLAFTALFTLVPALLLIASIAGLAFSEPGSHARIVASLAAQFPPLAEVLRRAVDTALAHAGAFSLISAAALAWSASGLVRDLDSGLALLFRDRERGRSLLRTVIEVVVVAVTVVGLGLIVVMAALPGPLSELFGLARLRLTAVATVAAMFALAYRFLPRPRPGWLDAIVPAVWAGVGASLLTGAFTVPWTAAVRGGRLLRRVRRHLPGPGLALVRDPAVPGWSRLGRGARRCPDRRRHRAATGVDLTIEAPRMPGRRECLGHRGWPQGGGCLEAPRRPRAPRADVSPGDSRSGGRTGRWRTGRARS